ncbi:MAG: hypothetical protein R3244_00635 [Thermoanaerobaculia bacterium]|nr:hypothetical protein [Thermoanaerobaculia bacterium]
MTAEPAAETIEQQVLAGENRNLQRLAAEGLVPLPPDRLVGLQVRLAGSGDDEIADLARRSLQEMDPRLIAPILARGDNDTVLEYFAENSEHPLLLETIVRLQGVSRTLLREMAGSVPPDLQEILILRQDAILEEPAILDALESNPELRPAVKRRIAEYRDHLFPKERPAEPEPEEAEAEEVHATPEEVAAAIAAAREESFEGEIDEETGLSEGQIRTLPIPVRLQLSRGASKTLRDVLIQDSNPQVATSALKHNAWSDGEIERIARMRTVSEEVLDAIGRSKRWMRKYGVVLALAKNPRTPIHLAVRLVPRLAVRDLRLLRIDRNVSEAVRSNANRLFMQKVK